MKLGTHAFGLLLIGAVALSACARPTSTAMSSEAMATRTPEAMMGETPEAMMGEGMATSTPEAMMSENMATATPKAMMDESMATSTPETMMGENMATATPEATMGEGMATPEAAMGTPEMVTGMPAWFATPLIDVATGQTLMVNDLKGKVVLVEDMAIWCTTCLSQQQQVQALHQMWGQRVDLANVTLDVDPHEDAAGLKAYVAKNRFSGTYAVAPADVAREIGSQLGAQFLNPTAAPMFVVDRSGQIHLLPFGVKSAQALADALKPFLDASM